MWPLFDFETENGPISYPSSVDCLVLDENGEYNEEATNLAMANERARIKEYYNIVEVE